MSNTTYNGWTNYETWNVALWIDNDEGSSSYWQDEAGRALEDADGDKDDAVSALANRLSDEIKDNAPDLGSSCYADLLGSALSDVNWYEIASGKVDEAKERWDEEHKDDEAEVETEEAQP